MSVLAVKRNPFDQLADVLPPVIDGSVLLLDGTFPGESRDPRENGALLPGDYFYEQDVWLRIESTRPTVDGTTVVCGREPFVTLLVPLGTRVMVWPLTSVVGHANAGGAL